MDAKILLQTFTDLKNEYRSKYQCDDRIVDIYISPRSTGLDELESGNDARKAAARQLRYSSMAPNAVLTLASHLRDNTTPESDRWFKLKPSRGDAPDDAAQWIDTAMNQAWQGLSASNFQNAITPTNIDDVLYSVGSFAPTERDTFPYVSYKAHKRGEFMFSLDFDGNPDGAYFERRYNPAQLMSKFGEEEANKHISDSTKNKTQGMIKVLYAVVENPAYEETTDTDLTVDKRPFIGMYVTESGEQIGETDGYYYLPAYVKIWNRHGDDKAGTSPAQVALPDVIELNELKKITRCRRKKTLDPPILAENGIFTGGKIDMRPGEVTFVGNINAIKEFPMGQQGRDDLTANDEQMLRKEIREVFYTDKLELKESPEMSATEVSARMALMNRLLSPATSNHREVLKTVVSDYINLLIRKGALETPPESIADPAKGTGLEISITSTLGRAQDLQDVSAFTDYLSVTLPLQQQAQGQPSRINLAKVEKGIARRLGVPESFFDSDEEFQQKQDDAKEAQDAANLAQQNQANAAAFKDASVGAKNFDQAPLA